MVVIAFRRKALREALEIRTIIVDHEVLLDPAEAAPTECIQLVGSVGRGSGGGFGGVVSRVGDSVEVKVAVICGERRVGPVGFNESATSGPVVCIPKRRVDSHGLCVGKRYAHCLCVSEFSYWIVVH